MAALYAGEPLPIEETPQFQPSALGPSLYTLGNIRYRVGDKSITIYSFEDESSDEDDRSDEEEEDIDADNMVVFRYVFRAESSPDSPEAAQEPIADVEEPAESSARTAEPSGVEASAGAGEVPMAAAAASAGPSSTEAGPSSEAGPSPPSLPPLAYWVARSGGRAPRGAVLVGRDLDGGPLYVGRACAYGELLAGKVAARHRVCYVASEGRELAFEKYEVLTLKRGRVEWVRGRHGSFPMDAFPAGLTLRNQRVYVARARVEDVLTPGRLVVGEKKCRISYDMKEYKYPEYEILTVRHMDPDESGMVRYVSAENLVRSEHRQKRFKADEWCGTHLSDEMEECTDQYDDEEEEEDEDENEFDEDLDGQEVDGQVLEIFPDDQVIFIE